ncbi:uncharacterized protein EI90DRAFT_2308303 [Cantharellus anzutake]|uniref:uncharacterized protein n=1 Tax=Cantharellus anzutake TaxID=1750568 RepID=UPI001902D875|nr:uncharacterized protein EI90DRAFT_2308303 [Cantharellus anzutake]KAF8339948.1 hypothetical protein EI90DRAFT_2308303 [Cantharellus anzutake]
MNGVGCMGNSSCGLWRDVPSEDSDDEAYTEEAEMSSGMWCHSVALSGEINCHFLDASTQDHVVFPQTPSPGPTPEIVYTRPFCNYILLTKVENAQSVKGGLLPSSLVAAAFNSKRSMNWIRIGKELAHRLKDRPRGSRYWNINSNHGDPMAFVSPSSWFSDFASECWLRITRRFF